MPENEQLIRERRYKIISLSSMMLTAILNNKRKLEVGNGVQVVAVQPNANLYPIGFSIILYSPDFNIVPDALQIPHEFNMRVSNSSSVEITKLIEDFESISFGHQEEAYEDLIESIKEVLKQ